MERRINLIDLKNILRAELKIHDEKKARYANGLYEKDIYSELIGNLTLDNLDLFTTLSARYTLLDRNFLADLPSYTNYYEKIVYTKGRLETYLLLDCFPIKYNENIANGLNIHANKLINKGNIGSNNSLNKTTTVETELSVSGNDNKKCFWKRLFRKK